jgi:hypothetical protein
MIISLMESKSLSPCANARYAVYAPEPDKAMNEKLHFSQKPISRPFVKVGPQQGE